MANTTDDFKRIVLEDISLIDVRAPIEYERGAFKHAVNLPIMTDDERHQVGLTYKEKGNEAARKLGYQLVSGDTKSKRVKNWLNHIEKNPNTMLYCFRGGDRSRISQEWMKDEGQDITRLKGGYKAFRNYLIQALDPSYQNSTPLLLGGYTGSGKTILLNKLKNSIDLEGLANHRGSSFGSYIEPQPSQINFENNLAYALIKHKQQGHRHMILEDEGRHIGKCYIPSSLSEFFKKGNLILMDVPLLRRVEITLDEYVHDSQKRYLNTYGEIGLEKWYSYISNGIKRIKKRLGGNRYNQVMKQLKDAYNHQIKTGDQSLHTFWIETILRDYYDPMYQYQIEKRTTPIIFKGDEQEVFQYLQEYCQ
ncbi:tRNA 2-selenouridine(34) synthase MnmH [Haloplasma contractile]|uniref:tRNA 2-selenouridine synthase protein n=1 Tax=Haloplasma contractile SSD-17B TaxID=1033810 RepID=U2FLS4_9MOLU|nr:tRNA 2-selenouridine(34) synthase MnmH [Haloplasma contractile]ERJ12139.1 tRNA 2-selenouridine synthase protein [Haloplasma contractile SSD-17B]